MAYITTSDLSTRLGTTLYARLTDRVNGTTANNTVAQEIVDAAEAEVDSYLSKRYATPINLTANSELNATLKARVLDVAEYRAWNGAPFVTRAPDRVASVYSSSKRWLADVAAGLIHLPAASRPASPTAEDDAPRYTAVERVFTADALDGL